MKLLYGLLGGVMVLGLIWGGSGFPPAQPAQPASSGGHTLEPVSATVPLGGQVALSATAPHGANFVPVVGVSGTEPGVVIAEGVVLHVNPDWLTPLVCSMQSIFIEPEWCSGYVYPIGGVVILTIAVPLNSSLSGLTLYVGCVVSDAQGVWATNTSTIQVQ
jgi:hypothetical protein